ncbi:MAG: adenosine-specific kinase [Candidatus Thermoplasmatota archaeon]
MSREDIELKMRMIPVEKPEDMNFILGQTHFIKSIEDIYEAIVNSVPKGKFGVAFAEASGACLVRSEGNDKELIRLAEENMRRIGAGHTFIVFMRDCYPLNILNSIKAVPEVCSIYCATANPTIVIVAESKDNGNIKRGILGVIDGFSPKGVESKQDKNQRKKFLRDIGYKL